MDGLLKIALPNKGRLAEQSVKLLLDAGFAFENGAGVERRLFAKCSNFPLEILFARAEDICAYVGDGVVDLGITGRDLVLERNAKVAVLGELGFGKCRLSVAAPKGSEAGVSWLAGKRVATSFPRITKKFFDEKKIGVELVALKGSVELAPRLGVADAIVDLVSSGNTLDANGLEEKAAIVDSEALLVSGKKKLGVRANSFLASVKSVLSARGKRYILANVPAKSLGKIRGVLGGLCAPTVSPLYGMRAAYAVSAVVSQKDVAAKIGLLKAAGASGILVTSIERLVE